MQFAGSFNYRSTHALGQIGDTRAVESLIALFQDKHIGSSSITSFTRVYIKVEIAKELGKMRDTRVVEPLIIALTGVYDEAGSSASVYAAAKEALEERNPNWMKLNLAREALPSLVTLLKDQNFKGRNTTAKILGQIDSNWAQSEVAQETISALVSALQEKDSGMRQETAWILTSLGWQPTDPTQQLLYAVALRNWDAVASLGEAGIEPLVAGLQDHSLDRQYPYLRSAGAYDREAAARALGKTGNPRAVEPLIGALMDTTVRNEVIEVLGILGDVRAVEPLIAVLQAQDVERKVTVRRTIEVLVGLGDLRAVEPLILTLQDQDIYVRFAAVEALSRLRDVRAVRPLVTIAGNTDQTIIAGSSVSISDRAIKGLQKVLEFCAPSIDPEDLRLIAALELEDMLKCRQVRQLARQELIRRGLQA